MAARPGPASNGHRQSDTESSQDRKDGLLPVVKFLQSSLAMKSKGDGLHYQHLVAQLLTRDDPETLWRLYLGLAQCVTIISQQPDEFKELIDAVFRFDWRAGPKIVQAFSGLLSQLISANGTCMVPAMHMLVRNLVLAPHDIDGEGGVDPAALLRQHNVHAALQASLALVPSGRSKLFGVLRQNYPHRRLRPEILSDYALHALRVVQYAPLMEESVLRLIIEKSLEIDVEIKIMDTGEAVVDEEDEECDALFTMDDLQDGTADAKHANTEEVDEMAEKLDGVMLVVLTYLDQRLTANASLPPETILETPSGLSDDDNSDGSSGDQSVPASDASAAPRKRRSSEGGDGVESVARLLKSLLVVFEENILPTYRSKFVQFVLFFACSRAPGLSYALSTKLVDVLRDDLKPKLTRQSGVAYLASFLARGSFVESSLVSNAVGALLDWAGSYLDRHSDVLAVPATPGTSGAKGFETPVATRVRARPQSWHGMNPPGSMGVNGRGAMLAPMSAKQGTPRAADHMLFYSVCQATFYVLCFRGEELGAMDDFGKQAAIWQRLLTCSLLPLRHCLDTVRREFARLCCSLMEEYLDPDLLDHLAGIAREAPQMSQTITVGSSFACSTPRSATSSSSTSWTPSRVTKAGGLGRGSNPLDSFFPFDPYLLRRSHVYVDTIYNTWKVQDAKASKRNRRRKADLRATADGRPRRFAEGSDSSASDSDSDHDSDSSGEEGDLDEMDANSLSFRDGASGLAELTRRQKADRKKRRARKKAEARDGDGSGECSSECSDDDDETGVSRKMADTYITESMSVTPASSVAVGSLMGRSLGKAMTSSFADDGLVWGGGGHGSVDDAFFHQNVSPSISPPIAPAMGGRSSAIGLGVRSKRSLF